MLAGAVEVDITPPVGVPMDGYGAREGSSVAIHDPLLAQALLLKSGDDGILLFTLDLLGVSLDFTHRVRARAAGATALDPANIMVACTHTHSGPAGFLPRVSGLGSEDANLQEITLRKLVGAAQWADSCLQPARVGVETGQITAIGRNRNDPESGPMDPLVTVVRVDDAAGGPLAVLMNYGCHPTVLGYGNRSISADYPGAARRLLRDVYPETVFLFTNGASGDVSTRFTRREQTFGEVERMGRILGGEVLRVMQLIETESVTTARGQMVDIDLPVRQLPSLQTARRVLDERKAELKQLKQAQTSHGDVRRATTRVEGAHIQLQLVQALAGREQISTQVQTLRMGDILCIGLPGEPFSRLVLDLKDSSPFAKTVVISYANDDVGYFPDERSIHQGTYEALSSPYGTEGVRCLQKAALALTQEDEPRA